MKLKQLHLRQIGWALAAVTLGSGASLVWAQASEGAPASPSPQDTSVAALLKERLPRTQVSRVNCQVVDGVCEVTAGSQLFYVDKSARYLMIGRVYDMQTRQDLTAVRRLEVNPDPAWANDGKLAFMAGFAGIAYPDMLKLILDAALTRLGLR